MPSKKKPYSVYFFAAYNPQGVSERYRGKYVLQELKRRFGVDYFWAHPGYSKKEILRFFKVYFKALLSAKKNDRIVVQKVCKTGIYGTAIKSLVRLRKDLCVYDTDDADYVRESAINIQFFASNCSRVIVGSKNLHTYFSVFNPQTHILPTSIIDHAIAKKKLDKVFHLGWVGDYGNNSPILHPYSHKKSFQELVIPALLQLPFPYKLSLMGVKNPEDRAEIRELFKDRPDVELDIPALIDWTNEVSIYRRISKFTVGLAPLVKHEFTLSKSAFKVKQYLSVGVPVIASPVGQNMEVVVDQVNGVFADSSKDFYNQIMRFKRMHIAEYKQFSERAKESGKKHRMSDYVQNLHQLFLN